MHYLLNKLSGARFVLTAAVFFSLLWGCSTQKDSFVNRAYHTVNAKYNGFFNARESYKEGVRMLDELHTDNYEQILSVFRYGDEQDASSVSANMDIVYEKASLVIRRHSMDIRGKEHNRWIDESYYLIGRSHFFKRDFTLAILTFEYIIRQYDTRRSYDAKVWIAKSYNEQGRYEQALRMLEILERHYRDGLLNDETVAMYRKAYADHFIRQGQYDRAARQLDLGIPYQDSRRERARLTFIQAQLYQHSGQYAKAQQTYGMVLDMRTDRSMAFQARIGMAMAFDPAVGGGAYIRDELMDMLSDDRYRPFHDQVYYALAQLAIRQENEEEAIAMLQRSVEVSVENDMQKGLSFLRLGEIFFEHPDYQKANVYYDSATTFLPASYDNYEEISRRQQILSGVSQLSQVIAHEDSLQALAALTPEEQNAVVDAIIEELREQERLAQEAERERAAAMRDAGRMARQTRGMGDQASGWYFYNTTAMSNGEMEFFGRFGDRPLEDLWRISNRQMIAGDFGMDLPGFEEPEIEEDTLEFDEFDRDTYLRHIPNSEEEMEASRNRQVQAYFNKGLIFRDQLRDQVNAVRSFDTVIKEFSGFEPELPAFYHLYYLLRETGDYSGAEMVKRDLLENYPDSEYAMIIGDPGYADRVRERQGMAEGLYRESYNAFFSGRYDVIARNRQTIDTLDVPRELKARFAYLHAMALGRADEQDQFVSELQFVVSEYTDTPVHAPASALLASLDVSDVDMVAEGEGRGRERVDRAPIDTPFAWEPDAVHFFVLVVDSREMDPSAVTRRLREFNEESFGESDLSVNNIFYKDDLHLVTVTNFENKETGIGYFNQWNENGLPNGEEREGVEPFIVSVANYPLFYQEQELDAYRNFFNYYYLNM